MLFFLLETLDSWAEEVTQTEIEEEEAARRGHCGLEDINSKDSLNF